MSVRAATPASPVSLPHAAGFSTTLLKLNVGLFPAVQRGLKVAHGRKRLRSTPTRRSPGNSEAYSAGLPADTPRTNNPMPRSGAGIPTGIRIGRTVTPSSTCAAAVSKRFTALAGTARPRPLVSLPCWNADSSNRAHPPAAAEFQTRAGRRADKSRSTPTITPVLSAPMTKWILTRDHEFPGC